MHRGPPKPVGALPQPCGSPPALRVGPVLPTAAVPGWLQAGKGDWPKRAFLLLLVFRFSTNKKNKNPKG